MHKEEEAAPEVGGVTRLRCGRMSAGFFWAMGSCIEYDGGEGLIAELNLGGSSCH